MSRPRLMKTLPHGPTIASMTPAIEGEATAARSGRSSTPYDSMVTSTSRQRTPRKPSTVATPTSLRFFA